jgi:uncharacterized damage-inducible protein DinB
MNYAWICNVRSRYVRTGLVRSSAVFDGSGITRWMPADPLRATGHHGSMTNPPAATLVPFLVDYLFWMRDRVLETAAALDAAAFLQTPRMHGRDLRATLAHEMDVEMSWRGKLQGLPIAQWGPDAEIRAERFSNLAELAVAWREEETATRRWLSTLSRRDLEQPTTVNELDGRPLAVYLLHVVEHGVTELSIASGLLDELGHEVGDLSVLRMLDESGRGTLLA